MTSGPQVASPQVAGPRVAGPRVAYITAGTAGMFCGSCLRDNALVAALRDAGHDVILIPTFTPLTTEGEEAGSDRIFLGGLNLYLAQKWPAWGRLPKVLRRPLDHPRLLGALSALALESRSEDDAALALSLMRGTDGHQRSQIEELVRWLAEDLRPDLVNVSNLLIAGFVPHLRQHLDVPVLVTLQGDELFLDEVNETDRKPLVDAMRRLAQHVDGFVVFSRFYRDFMADLLRLPKERFHLVPLGLRSPEDFQPREPDQTESRPPTLGYLARIYPAKGLHLLVDAFLELRRGAFPDLRLAIGGWLGKADRPYFENLCRRLDQGGARGAYRHHPLPDRAAKASFLRALDVFSVPVTYPEHKGLYALEALAAGVPVVLPDAGVFPEMLAETGGGRRVPPGDSSALAGALAPLLTDSQLRQRLGEEGRRGVLASRRARHMAEATWAVYQGYFAGNSY